MGLTIIGTSHIAAQSLEEIREAIEKGKPDIIALELDRKRLPSLMARKSGKIRASDIFKVGLKGYLFASFGSWAEKKLGESVGIKPGAEMKLAVQIAHKKKIPIALIDQDIEITLRELSRAITWREKFRFLWDIIKGVAKGKPEFSFDLRTVPSEELIGKMVERIRVRFPHVYRVLIIDRNRVMIGNLRRLLSKNPEKNVLAIVGAGHKKEIAEAFPKEGEVSISYVLPKGVSLRIG